MWILPRASNSWVMAEHHSGNFEASVKEVGSSGTATLSRGSDVVVTKFIVPSVYTLGQEEVV